MNFSQKAIISLIGKFFSAIFALLISVFLARYLGVSGVGQYQLILSTQVVIITILAMGFGNASIYFINSEKINRITIVSNLFKLFIVIAIFLSIVLGFSLFFFKEYFGYINLSSIIIFVTGSAALLMYNILMPTLYASLEIIKLQILNFSSTIFILLSILFFNKLGYFNINVALSIYGIGAVVATTILFVFLKNDLNLNEKINFSLIKRLFFYGIKLSATNFVFILSTNIVLFLMKYFIQGGFEAIGLFSRATAIANMFLLLSTTLGPLLYSKWSRLSEDKLHLEVEKALRIIVLLTILCTIFTILFGEKIIILLYGVKFIGAEPALIILSSSIIFSSMTIVLSNVFSSIGKPIVTLKIFTISLFITTLLSLILIPIFEIEGAAFSVLGGLMYNVFVLTYYVQKEIGVSILNSLFIRREDFNVLIKALKNA